MQNKPRICGAFFRVILYDGHEEETAHSANTVRRILKKSNKECAYKKSERFSNKEKVRIFHCYRFTKTGSEFRVLLHDDSSGNRLHGGLISEGVFSAAADEGVLSVAVRQDYRRRCIEGNLNIKSESISFELPMNLPM